MSEAEAIGVAPDEPDEPGALASKQEDAVAPPPAGGDPGDVGHEPDAADDRGGRDGPAAGLVIQRDVARDDRDLELGCGRRDPVDRTRELPGDLRAFGVAEVEAVGEGHRLPAGTG